MLLLFFFGRFTATECSYVLIFHKIFDLLTAKTTQDVNNSLIFT